MTAHEETEGTARPFRLVRDPLAAPAAAPAAEAAPAPAPEPPPIARPMPRLGRGIVWSSIVAEIEQDHQERLGRLRDAA
ncbi:DUF6222 family protein [Amycolatopsis rifamycinica]|uniref:Uncharacterized protein n=1 Tax=Amycolatopsis rifamycinica TaxID=287986 RepID=A0A066TUK8_9PSEU|nr:DUF6222 family protein [Amycolatopsis rifamycinica]KDN18876.1 hypothetical protein DV20_28425 [Amycolatopsis rifamycinica]